MCVARAPSVLTNMFDLGSESQGLDVQTNVMHCGVVDKVGFLTFCRYLWQGSIIAASTSGGQRGGGTAFPHLFHVLL